MYPFMSIVFLFFVFIALVILRKDSYDQHYIKIHTHKYIHFASFIKFEIYF